jgi:pyruvate,water dikinase
MWIKRLQDVGLGDVATVGGKNASLGELLRGLTALGIRVPEGFAVTADGYRRFIEANGLEGRIADVLASAQKGDLASLERCSREIRAMMTRAPMPPELERAIVDEYAKMARSEADREPDVAVRSSATAEDLPNASFAGQQETYLNVQGAAAVVSAVRDAFASLFTARAISYRADMGFESEAVALSVGVQRMVRSDRASAGVMFTLDTDTGHRGVVLVTSSFGLGECVVQGQVVPDQFVVHKDRLRAGFRPLIRKVLGSKETRCVYDPSSRGGVKVENTPEDLRASFSLDDEEVLTLADWAIKIEDHYSKIRGREMPMDIEWAKDGVTGELFVVQARPETVHSQRSAPSIQIYKLAQTGRVLATGLAVGDSVAAGRVRVVRDPENVGEVQPGDVLVTEVTDPNWEPIMKRAAAIVTDRGGRTSHAAIVARELGVPAIVGTGNATSLLGSAGLVTVSCAEGECGQVYEGKLDFSVERIDPETLPKTRTRIMLNVGDPDNAFRVAMLPCDGVGLARMEFIFASWVGVHPLALTRYGQLDPNARREVDARTDGYGDKTQFFVDRLSQGVGVLAAAFWPRPVILRFSDFKTNEYARLIGGAQFEPLEENPMLGWRGASRYYHPNYKEGFLLEVAAVRRVRETFGLTNLKVMIPFCRTPNEARRVLETMKEGGLTRGQGGLEVYVMAEIPSNILMADEFATIFDGFSIGSNDLTQLTLGVDRDSTTVAPLFDERIEAVKWSCAHLLEVAHAHGRQVGICGQAPSDYPDFAAFLVERGIDSISLNADAFARTRRRVHEVELEKGMAKGPQSRRAQALVDGAAIRQ